MKQSIQTGSQQAARDRRHELPEVRASAQDPGRDEASGVSSADGKSKGAQLIAQAADATIKAFGEDLVPIPALIHNVTPARPRHRRREDRAERRACTPQGGVVTPARLLRRRGSAEAS